MTCFDLFCGVATTVDGHLAAGSVRWILCKLLKGGRGGAAWYPSRSSNSGVSFSPKSRVPRRTGKPGEQSSLRSEQGRWGGWQFLERTSTHATSWLHSGSLCPPLAASALRVTNPGRPRGPPLRTQLSAQEDSLVQRRARPVALPGFPPDRDDDRGQRGALPDVTCRSP